MEKMLMIMITIENKKSMNNNGNKTANWPLKCWIVLMKDYGRWITSWIWLDAGKGNSLWGNTLCCLSVLYMLMPGGFMSQGINRHGIDPLTLKSFLFYFLFSFF